MVHAAGLRLSVAIQNPFIKGGCWLTADALQFETMLVPVIFLIFAIYIFIRSLKLLHELLPQPRKKGMGWLAILMHVSGLFVWFSVGVVAFMVSMTGLTRNLILVLQ
jgi:hypothetical protein